MPDKLVAQIISLIEANLEDRPDNQKEIARTLLALLKIKERSEYYFKNCLFTIAHLEEWLDGKNGQTQTIGDKYVLDFPTLENAAKAALLFTFLNELQEEQVKNYLLSLLPINQDSLEKYLSESLNLKSEPYCPKSSSPTSNGFAALSAMHGSRSEEDFQLVLPKNYALNSEVIKGLVVHYCKKRGYNLFSEYSGLGFFFLNEKENVIVITVTPIRDLLLVRVDKH